MITSTKNPLIKEIRRLRRDKHARQAANLFVVEGIQGVVAAVQHHATIQALLYAPDRLTSEIARHAIDQAAAQGVRCEPVTAEVFESLSERDNPIGLLALVQRPPLTLETLTVHPTALYVGLFEVSDPGNLGTVIRTLDAVGGQAIILIGATVDPFHPTTVKASAGTIFARPILSVPDLQTLLTWCQQQGVTPVATSDRAPQPYWLCSYPTPLLLLMGSEAHGLPQTYLDTLPHIVSIPMYGTVDSLNLGIATALILYEIRRQQHAPQA